jgi:hypothetical protein
MVGDDLKLPIAMNVASQGQRFASLATPQAMAFQKGVTRRPLPWTSLFDKDLEQKVVTKRASLMQNSG